MATHATTWFGVLSSSASSVAVGDAVVLDSDGYFRVATTANRASYGRSRGIAKTAASGVGATFEYQVAGVLGATDSNVGTGTADDWVVVNATGQLERTATVSAGQDVVGRCPHTTGDVQIAPGVWSSANVVGAGATAVTGTGFWRSTSGTLDAAASAVNLAGGATHVTGTLPIANGGTGATSFTADQVLVGHASALTTAANVKAGSGFVSIGATPATTGGLRLANNTFVFARDAANGQNVQIIGLNASDDIIIGGTGTGDIIINATTSKQMELIAQEMFLKANALQIGPGGVLDTGGGVGVIGIDEASGNPSTNPTNGIVAYVDSADNTLKYRKETGIIIPLHGTTGTCTLEQFGAVGDGVTSDQTAFADALSALSAGTYDTILLGAKTYLISGGQLTAGTSIRGQGDVSVLKTTSDATVIDIPGVENITLADFKILGNATGTSQIGLKTSGVGASEVRIDNVSISSMGQYGLLLVANGSSKRGPIINNLRVDACGSRAVSCSQEYVRFSNLMIKDCTVDGFVIGAGNVDADVMITNCARAIWILALLNDAHGIIRGQINHCTTAVEVEAATNNTHTFDGVHVYDGAITIGSGNAQPIAFNGCVLDVTTYTLSGAKARFNDCRVRTAYFSAYTDNTSSDVDWTNSRHVDGTLPTWIGQKTHLQYTFPGDVDQTLSARDSRARIVEILAGVVTATRKLTMARAPSQGEEVEVINRTGQTINFYFSSGNGIAIPTLKTALVGADGSKAICRLITDNVATGVAP